MRINIEPVRKKESASTIDFDYEVHETKKSGYVDLLRAKRIDYLNIAGKVSQKNGLVAIEYRIKAKFDADCARCGSDIREIIEFDGEGYIANKSEEEEKGGSGEFYFTETDGILELDDFIVEFLGVWVPHRYLCFEDCKGLCYKCGKNLNDGDCGCQKKEKNPAFKILDDLKFE